VGYLDFLQLPEPQEGVLDPEQEWRVGVRVRVRVVVAAELGHLFDP
jgi:hypothetical protein